MKYRIVRDPTYGICVQEWKRSFLYNLFMGGWVYIWNASLDWPANFGTVEKAEEWIKCRSLRTEVVK